MNSRFPRRRAALQMIFFLLLSMLPAGFMTHFRGMLVSMAPDWAVYRQALDGQARTSPVPTAFRVSLLQLFGAI